MNSRAGITRLPRTATGGFSLVELLLAVALLVLLFGAVAFNFSSLQRGAELEEGARQLEALLRYARAHAANSGHKVRLSFEEDAGDGLLVPLGNLDVTWEADPLAQPGVFITLPETAGYVSSILDVISIENVRPPGALTPATPDGLGPNNDSAPAPGATTVSGNGPASADPLSEAGSASTQFGFAPIVFYPDGASDSVEITIALRHSEEDARRMKIRLNGLTGMIRRQILVDESLLGSPEIADPSSTTAGPGHPSGGADRELPR
jgi:type II secretory pathway pseudopilin PulG